MGTALNSLFFVSPQQMCNNAPQKGGMTLMKRQFIAIDLKSFYASVEAAERATTRWT